MQSLSIFGREGPLIGCSIRYLHFCDGFVFILMGIASFQGSIYLKLVNNMGIDRDIGAGDLPI